jgi:putative Mg2+ transporter-C (MgtC) family protein
MPPDLTMALRILLAAVLGGAIGYQRERAGKPAGLRTHMLICMGAALFTLVSIFGFTGPADPSRVAAGVVTGIGFIGAGAIIFRSQAGYVTGLTTAATIWAVAGIGVAVGAGLYIASAVTTAIVLGILFIPHLK